MDPHHVKKGSLFEYSTIGSVTFVPVKCPQPFVQSWIIMPDHLQVACEDVVVCHIDPDQRGVKPDIGLGDIFANG
jgi:hypothetical protein